jgi:hypothetical protein
MQTEGLRPWVVPEILLFAQAEKVGYERYPDPPWDDLAGTSRMEEIPVTGYSERLGRTWTGLAREAMREHRSVGVAQGMGKDTAFDEPLRLIRVTGAAVAARPAPAGASPVLDVHIPGSPAQLFLEAIASAVEAPFLKDLFPPEALLASGRTTSIEAVVRNAGRDRIVGTASLRAPAGWRVSPPEEDLTIEAGASKTIAWSVEAVEGEGPRLQPGEIVIGKARKGGEIRRTPIVLNRGRRPAPPKPG